MTAPTCGARTWGHGEAVACEREAGHDGKHGNAAYGLWLDALCFIEIGDRNYGWTVDEARAVRDLIQAQLDALDPDAAIAEAEHAWLAALERAATLDAMLSEVCDVETSSPFARRRNALLAAVKRADAHAEQAEAAWLALVEARDAKDGGA